ncbi:MAG: hypothetical protein FWC72_07700, partial [Oscillospiraceae bacterium]|nr:hypothetical protein [Oscillospiraceae bacterium]
MSARRVIDACCAAVLNRRLASFSIAFAAAAALWQFVPAWYWVVIPAISLVAGGGYLRAGR